jgi:hypothetical protein
MNNDELDVKENKESPSLPAPIKLEVHSIKIDFSQNAHRPKNIPEQQ